MISLRKPVNWFFLLNSIGVFVLLIVMSLLIDRDIFSSDEGLFVRKAVVCAVAAYAAQVAVRRRFFSVMHYHPLLIMSWYFLFGLFKCFVMDNWQIEADIYIGAYMAITLILAESLINDCLFEQSWNYVLDIIKLGLLLLPLLLVLQYLLGVNPLKLLNDVRQLNRAGAGLVYVMVGVPLLMVLRYFSLSRKRLQLYETRFLNVNQKPRNWLVMLCLVLAAAYYPCKILLGASWLERLLL